MNNETTEDGHTYPDGAKTLRIASGTIPFEDRVNPSARLSDISTPLIEEFLSRVGNRGCDHLSDMPLPAIAERLGLLDSTGPEPLPMNLALMFFNHHPEDFFPYSWIEIVYKPDQTGMGMREHKVRGPVDRQIRDALSVIENTYITEYVTKRNDRAEAIREYNYPLEAVREAVVNAIYHRGYDSEQPVTVYIMQDRMEITSAPGPDPSISDADLKEGHLLTRYNRNRRLGEFLKDLNLAEGRGTGIPLMQEFMDRNGSDPPVFETDSKRSYMTVILPVNSRFLPEGRTSKGSPVPKSKEEATFDTVVSLLKTNGPMSTREIATAMGYDMPPTSLRTALKYMMLSGRIRYLYPNSPHAGRQKIVLVEND